jgi:hypothetical protein
VLKEERRQKARKQKGAKNKRKRYIGKMKGEEGKKMRRTRVYLTPFEDSEER